MLREYSAPVGWFPVRRIGREGDSTLTGSRRRQRRAAVAIAGLITLGAGRAEANGGPVAWTGPTVGEGIAPLERTDIALVSEDLVIELEPDARHYRVRARYLLSNPDRAKTVLFGVPVFTVNALLTDSEMRPRRPRSLARLGRTVEITAGGRRTGCRLGKPAAPPLVPAPPPSDDDPYSWHRPDGWCVARVEIPSGTEVPLELRYRGELEFEDGEVSSSSLYNYNERQLWYDFSAAGYWAGRVRQVKVTLRLGELSGSAVQASPPPERTQSGELTWTMTDLDLKTVKPLSISINPHRILEQRQLVAEGATLKRLRARASSTLASPDRRYDPARVVDASASTAWCEGDEGDGRGAWIEVAFAPRRQAGTNMFCGMEGIAIVPGYARPGAYEDNGRVRRVRLSSCGGDGDPLELDVGELDPLPHGAARLLSTRRGPREVGPGPDLYGCFRLTLVDVLPGKRHQDTCISALFPVFNCESLIEDLGPVRAPF